MKPVRFLSIVLTAFIFVLVAANGCLLQQNLLYRSENRQLRLQNDSVMSANLQFSRQKGQGLTDSIARR